MHVAVTRNSFTPSNLSTRIGIDECHTFVSNSLRFWVFRSGRNWEQFTQMHANELIPWAQVKKVADSWEKPDGV